MNNNRHARIMWFTTLAVAIGLGCLLLAACGQSLSSPVPAPPASPPPEELPAEEADVVAELSPTVAPVPSGGITLTWWTPEFFSPSAGDASGEVLAQQIAGFVTMQPDIGVQPILKAAHGKGGILDFLRTANAAAPSVLPDVITIDTSDLPAAVQNGLMQPLDGLLSAELRDDLFPFALNVGQFDRQWYAVQFEADVQHLVYRTDKVQEPPSTWDELLSGRGTYIFPAAGREGLLNDASLIQYLGAGGKLDETTRQLSLAEQPLREMLTFYQQGAQRRRIPPQVLTFANVEACWPAYLSGDAEMTNALASRYLAERDALKDSGFAALPTMDGQAVTISRGWALAIVTTDAVHQAAATQFVEWLLAPEHSAAWTQAARRLPTRRSALDAWGTEEGYAAFLDTQLEAATFHPSGAGYVETARWLQQAVRDVLSGSASPEEAVEQALEASAP